MLAKFLSWLISDIAILLVHISCVMLVAGVIWLMNVADVQNNFAPGNYFEAALWIGIVVHIIIDLFSCKCRCKED